MMLIKYLCVLMNKYFYVLIRAKNQYKILLIKYFSIKFCWIDLISEDNMLEDKNR